MHLELTHLCTEMTIDLASQRLNSRITKLVCTAIPTDINEGVKSNSDNWGCGCNDTCIEEHEEVADGDGY